MLSYQVIEVFTSEEARWNGKPVHEAIETFIRQRRIAARVVTTRAIAGCYENGEVATSALEILSFNMPLKIEIVLPAAETEGVLPGIQERVGDGIIGVRELGVASHRAWKHFIPRHLRVRDVMTANPRRVTLSTPVADAVRLLLQADFNGLPVVDEANHPIGIVTQGDLIARGGMPLRLGLMDQLGADNLDAALSSMASKTMGEIMTRPVVVISQDAELAQAVDTMLSRGLKRLPAVDADGKLAGMLARLDIFRAISSHAADWNGLRARHVDIANLRQVRDIMRRDTHAVLADASLDDVMRAIDASGIQRLAVVDAEGALRGLISDREVFSLFSVQKASLWDRLVRRLTFADIGDRLKDSAALARRRTARDIMIANPITVGEEALIDEAIRLMTEHRIKRLPVVDGDGKFKGMIGRDSLLRAGAGAPAA